MSNHNCPVCGEVTGVGAARPGELPRRKCLACGWHGPTIPEYEQMLERSGAAAGQAARDMVVKAIRVRAQELRAHNDRLLEALQARDAWIKAQCAELLLEYGHGHSGCEDCDNTACPVVLDQIEQLRQCESRGVTQRV